MFHSGRWAAALINSIEKEGGEPEDGIEFLKVLAAWVKHLPGEVFGSYAAERAETLIRGVMIKTGTAEAARETAIRFFALMVKKNGIRHLDRVLGEAKKLLNKKHGVVSVTIESAFPADENTEARIREEIKKQTGAGRVDLARQINPDLIGGYRLRIGDEIIDSSVRSQLRELLAALQSGRTAYGGI